MQLIASSSRWRMWLFTWLLDVNCAEYSNVLECQVSRWTIPLVLSALENTHYHTVWYRNQRNDFGLFCVIVFAQIFFDHSDTKLAIHDLSLTAELKSKSQTLYAGREDCSLKLARLGISEEEKNTLLYKVSCITILNLILRDNRQASVSPCR